MMITLIVVAVLFVLIVIYGIGGRDWLRKQPWTAWFYSWVEPVEIVLWRKSETILLARSAQVLGLVTGILGFLGVIDLSPFLIFVPEKHRIWVGAIPSMALALNGIIIELFRRNTTKPLELVELSDNVSPKVAAAVEAAEVAKVEAVAVVAADAEKKP